MDDGTDGRTQHESDVPPIADWNRLLDGKVAVVTGGGDGIGGAISRLFADHGALVEFAEIDPERAERKRQEIADAGGTVRAHVLDVTEHGRTSTPSPNGCSAPTGASTCSSTTSAISARSYASRSRRPSRGTGSTRSTCSTSSPSPARSSGRWSIRARARSSTSTPSRACAAIPGDPVYGAMKAGGRALHDLPRRHLRTLRRPGQRHRHRPHPDPAGRLHRPHRPRLRTPLAGLGARWGAWGGRSTRPAWRCSSPPTCRRS